MSEDLFQLIALGLLAVLVVVLIVVALQLTKLRGALKGGSTTPEATDAGSEMAPQATAPDLMSQPEAAVATMVEPEEPVTVGGVTLEPEIDETSPAAVGPSSNGESEAVPPWESDSEPEIETPADPYPAAAAQEADDVGTVDKSDQPFERDGRWWFERDGELLVYDDRSGQWVPADDETASTGPSVTTATVPPAEGAPEPAAEPPSARGSKLISDDTVTEPEPVPQMDPDPTPVGVTTPVEDELHPLDEPRPDGAPFTAAELGTPEPAPVEPAAAEQPAVEQPAASEEAQPSASFWKCPSCGVVNGSTAHSCRMCFTARP